jgi:hypothetical protein
VQLSVFSSWHLFCFHRWKKYDKKNLLETDNEETLSVIVYLQRFRTCFAEFSTEELPNFLCENNNQSE